MENLLAAWREFLRGKRKKRDVQEFQYKLMDNILALHRELKEGTYKHGGYQHFRISDPKPRDIHKATVRDRLLHHALYRKLYPFFDRTWIADSYSCRKGKGTHKAMDRFREFAFKVSRNHTRTAWVLKCDIRKFFASIDHCTLNDIVSRYISDKRTIALITEVVGSFRSAPIAYNSPWREISNHVVPREEVRGLPLGNLTSQLLVNVYMNEFDQFVKHVLKVKYYARYADDFVFLSRDKQELITIERYIAPFLREHLKLDLHPDKVFIKTLASGVDFLGWVHFSDHRTLRTATKRRMFRNLAGDENDARAESYRGLLRQGNAKRLLAQVSVDRS